MPIIADIAHKVRSKNAGPFWVTVDVFCGSNSAYARLLTGLPTARVADLFALSDQEIRRFDIDGLNVIKFSFPRPVIQGHAQDRDMHGAQFATLLEELLID